MNWHSWCIQTVGNIFNPANMMVPKKYHILICNIVFSQWLCMIWSEICIAKRVPRISTGELNSFILVNVVIPSIVSTFSISFRVIWYLVPAMLGCFLVLISAHHKKTIDIWKMCKIMINSFCRRSSQAQKKSISMEDGRKILHVSFLRNQTRFYLFQRTNFLGCN